MAHDETQPTREEQPTQTSETNARTPAPPKSVPINMALAELQGELDLPESGGHLGEQSPPDSAALADPLISRVPEQEPDAAHALNSSPGANDMAEHYSSPTQGTTHSRQQLSPAATIATMMILSFVSGIIGAVLGLSSANKANSTMKGAEAQGPAVSAADIDGLKNDMAELKNQRNEEMDGLEKQLEALKKSTSAAPELAAIQQRVNEIAKSTNGMIAPVNETIKSLDSRLAGLEKSVKSMSESGADHRNPVATASAAGGTPSASEPEKGDTARPVIEDVAASDAALSEGTALYKQGKYQEAYDVFKKLDSTNPNDPRVWYYAALSQGFASNDWKGEPIRLVEKGLEREKAGPMKSADIDTAFKDLTVPTGKDWLHYYRKLYNGGVKSP